jgi:methionyl-tRNA formyltransferase
VNDETVLATLRSVAPDFIYVIGWSQLCKAPFLASAGSAVVGYHPSALPRNRGRAVIPWTILLGLDGTGSTLFRMDEGMDSGDVLGQAVFAVAEAETARSLYDKHLAALGDLLASHVANPEEPGRPQDHTKASYCSQRLDADGLVDWSKPARSVWTLIRAVGTPYPGASTYLKGQQMRLWEADLVTNAPYAGISGQVQAVDGRSALIHCGDGQHVSLTSVSVGGGLQDASSVLRVQDRLSSKRDAAGVR